MGAWIETYFYPAPVYLNIVAPRVGAWIETLQSCITTSLSLSHPVWVRGLKLPPYPLIISCFYVAPRVGAWIETIP